MIELCGLLPHSDPVTFSDTTNENIAFISKVDFCVFYPLVCFVSPSTCSCLCMWYLLDSLRYWLLSNNSFKCNITLWPLNCQLWPCNWGCLHRNSRSLGIQHTLLIIVCSSVSSEPELMSSYTCPVRNLTLGGTSGCPCSDALALTSPPSCLPAACLPVFVNPSSFYFSLFLNLTVFHVVDRSPLPSASVSSPA